MHSSATPSPLVFETATPEARYAAVCAGAVEYLPDLRAFARALTGNGHQADDLVQTAILRALNAAQQFTPGTNFKAWSFTILRNVFYSQGRLPAFRHFLYDDRFADTPATAPTQDASLEFCDFRRAFAQLARDQREALLLIVASGLSYSEAAAVCNCAPGTMKSRASRARTALRVMMNGGLLNLRRRDLTPISAMDPIRALETCVAADNLAEVHARSMKLTGGENSAGAAVGEHTPVDLDNAPRPLRS